MSVDRVSWTAIVLTSANREWTHTLQQELEIRQAKGYIDKDVILLTVEDPKSNVGSGGATINALLTIVEFLSAKKGYTVINPDVLLEAHILILHSGRSYPYDSCSRPFTTLPVQYSNAEYDGLVTSIDLLLKVISEKIAVKSRSGVWISSTDMMLSIPSDADVPWVESEVCVITMPSTIQYCKDHGVYKLDAEGNVKDILYQQKADVLGSCQRRDGSVPVVAGVVYFNNAVASKLLSFHTKPPLDACTYMGLDSGQAPLKLSLFFDVLLPMTGLSENEFVAGERNRSFSKYGQNQVNVSMARKLWQELHDFRIKACMIETGEFHYLPDLSAEHKKILLNCPLKACNYDNLTWNNVIHSSIGNKSQVSEDSVVINSILQGEVTVGSKTTVSHSYFQGKVVVGKDSIVAGLRIEDFKMKKILKFGEDLVIQGFNIHLKTLNTNPYVLTVHGRFDNIMSPTWKTTSTFCNDLWLVFLDRTGILREDLWGTDVENDDQTIYTAKLYPVFHATDQVGLEEILWLQGQTVREDDKTILKRWRSSWRLSLMEILQFINLSEEFQWRKELFYKISQQDLVHVLTNREHKGFCNVFNSASVENFSQQILQTLDKVAEKATSPGLAARTLANIADVLGSMAGLKGGLRSGPAANKSWSKAFNFLEANDIAAGVHALAKERDQWLGRPDLLVRAARHYEGAAAILVRQAVMTAKEFFRFDEATPTPMNKWVTAECPARIDVSGGWSDTPPITYEHGGAVTIIGVLINGKRPIGARARRIEEPVIRLEITGDGVESQIVVCKELHDLEDYCQPHSPGALLKASFICVNLINLSSSSTLAEQLTSKYSGGFEMKTWSNLPHGSGLGTSSILAGAILGALLCAAGKKSDRDSLIHAVLYLEQLLTTGGGWQDQIGGLCGGIHLGLSEAKLPLKVETVDLKVPQTIIDNFNKRLVLVYTGRTRLARNLLQDVLRNWYARNPYIMKTEDSLVDLAKECSHAVIEGNLDNVGSCISRNWSMKKLMAPGCETETIEKIMSLLRPHASGMCMAGAGGGGFLYAIMKESDKKQFVQDLLTGVEGLEDVVLYDICVDKQGLTVSVED
ncbi:L-fucose kinase-like [Gigantopelta aegis]|uniref:L-fucose kinase-like n=1 Tax=Gigantopelta aegis TaxID=1735272 RepID=UPI001B88AE41|nr:L-fucose kinase-like [Gigantopelta aegis]